MIRKWFVSLAVVTCAVLLASCSQLKNDTIVTTKDTDEILSPITDYEEYDTAYAPTTENILISDEEAVELFKMGVNTVWEWLQFSIYFDPTADNFIYRDYGNHESLRFFPLSTDDYASLRVPDMAGNTRIYYGDHDWMQNNLRTVFSEKFIEKYFSYNYPYPLIYENGVVYMVNPGDAENPPRAHTNYTVIHKTEDEIAIMCEVYKYDFSTYEYDYSDIFGLEYMKFIKAGDAWLIDEYNTCSIIPYASLDDKIPSEYKEKVPSKYYEMTHYFEN